MMAPRDSPLVSVIMPSFNQSSFIAASVESVLSQDYQPLELIVMDGSSTDGTQAVLASLHERYGARLRWYSEPDSGPAEAINKAIRLARGEFLGWLNSDDVYTQGAVSRAVSNLLAHPDWVMAYGHGQWIDIDGRVTGDYPSQLPQVGQQAFQSGCFICQPTVFMRSSLLDEVGLLDQSWATVFDFDLWLRVFERFESRIGFVDQIQAFSRLHDECITSRMRGKVASENVSLLARHFGYVPTHWLATHRDELLANALAAEILPTEVSKRLSGLLDDLADCFAQADVAEFKAQMSNDWQIKLADLGVASNCYPDGWVGQSARMVLREAPRFAECLVLLCRTALTSKPPLSLRVETEEKIICELAGELPEKFLLRVPLQEWVGRTQGVSINASSTFVPAFSALGDSTDMRQLAFQILDVRFE
jgi:hypothetical protein